MRELREYAARRGWEIAGEYVDTGWSGAKASRPELDHPMVTRSSAVTSYLESPSLPEPRTNTSAS